MAAPGVEPGMTTIDLGRPLSGDVVELILADHRRFEDLLRKLRNDTSDREAVRAAFSTLHVAHAEAEEKFVYPALRKKSSVTEHEAEHGKEEHAEGTDYRVIVRHGSEADRDKHERLGFFDGWGSVTDALAALSEAEA